MNHVRLSQSTETPQDTTPAPAPFLHISQEDKNDAMKHSELAAAILENADNTLRADIIKSLLLQFGTSSNFVNARDSRGRTALMYAIADCAVDVVRVLIDWHTVDLLARDRFGNTALMYAVGHGYEIMVHTFLGALKKRTKNDDRVMLNYLHVENYDGDTALELALKAGHEECALALSEFLNEALKQEKSRKSSIAYRLGFGRRSPPLQHISRKNVRKNNGIQQSMMRARRRSLDEGTRPRPISYHRKSSD